MLDAAMDEEHRSLFLALEELRHSVLEGQPGERVGVQAGRLSSRFAAHFRNEERSMRASRYGGITWHEQQHQRGRGLLIALQNAVCGKGGETVHQALDALAGWMLDHVNVSDRMFGAYFRNYERERTVEV